MQVNAGRPPPIGKSENLLVRNAAQINCSADRDELEGIGTPEIATASALPCRQNWSNAWCRNHPGYPRISDQQIRAPRRRGVMKGGQLWHRVCVIVLLVTIPDIARSGSSGLHVLADRQIQLVANPEKGALLFQQRCSMCHTTQEGGSPNISGPNLHGLFGRQAGTLPEYNYSADLRASRIVWNALTLDEFWPTRTGADREIRCHTPAYRAKPTATISSPILSELHDKQRLGGCGRERSGIARSSRVSGFRSHQPSHGLHLEEPPIGDGASEVTQKDAAMPKNTLSDTRVQGSSSA